MQRDLSSWQTSSRVAALAALLLVGCSSESKPAMHEQSHDKRIVILGVDGMDYTLTKQLMSEGKLPNLARLSEQGGFSALKTTDPPQSPVAWSTFITGLNPSEHGIYDFVHRDPKTMDPFLSTSRVDEVDCVFAIGDFAIPYCSPEMLALRRGDPFWDALTSADIPTAIYKVPANFPPDEASPAATIAGMGTPDVMGTYGTFQFVTTDPAFAEMTPSGGIVHPAKLQGSRIAFELVGPPDSNSVAGDPMKAEGDLLVDAKAGAGVVRLGDTEVVLKVGEWSGWTPMSFPGFMGSSVPGMARFFLKSVDPHVSLYISPVNIDPLDPLMPVSSPANFAADFAERAGRFYTQGMPEDTKALSAGTLSDDEFLAQADSIFEERHRMLRAALDSYQGGLLFFYFSSVDQVSHMFWGARDTRPNDPLYAYRDIVEQKYLKMDEVIGEVLDRVGENTTVMVMSDHGFSHYERKVNLNTWLFERGFLDVLPPDKRGAGALGHVDWSRTQAYALGLNQLFVNLVGREPHGIVPAGEREAVIRRLKTELSRFRDPDTGRRVVREVVDSGADPSDKVAPDLIVGYARTYRSSDSSAMGSVGETSVEKNEEHWNGDHCMASDLVPGVVFANRPLAVEDPSLLDFAPTLYTEFGVPVPDFLPGRTLLKEK